MGWNIVFFFATMKEMKKIIGIFFTFYCLLFLTNSSSYAASCSITADGSNGANVNLTSAGANERVVVALKVPTAYAYPVDTDNDGVDDSVNMPGCTLDMIQSVYICGVCGTTDASGNVTLNISSTLLPKSGGYVYAVGKEQSGGCYLASVGAYIYCRNAAFTVKEGAITESINIIKPTACGCVKQDERGRCVEPEGIETAIGCFPTEPKAIMTWFLTVGAVVGGAVAFLRMIWGAFLTIMSSGDPEKLKEGQETIVSAIEGLLLIIFAVFILRLLGVTILKIPGFG